MEAYSSRARSATDDDDGLDLLTRWRNEKWEPSRQRHLLTSKPTEDEMQVWGGADPLLPPFWRYDAHVACIHEWTDERGARLEKAILRFLDWIAGESRWHVLGAGVVAPGKRFRTLHAHLLLSPDPANHWLVSPEAVRRIAPYAEGDCDGREQATLEYLATRLREAVRTVNLTPFQNDPKVRSFHERDWIGGPLPDDPLSGRKMTDYIKGHYKPKAIRILQAVCPGPNARLRRCRPKQKGCVFGYRRREERFPSRSASFK